MALFLMLLSPVPVTAAIARTKCDQVTEHSSPAMGPISNAHDGPPGPSMAQLQDRLEQVEDSLATALARIEAQRNRDKLLTRENQLLRRMLKEAGVRNVPGTHQGSSPGPSPSAAGRQGQDTASTVLAAMAGEGEESNLLGGAVDGHPIYVWTPEGKLPGSILVTPTSLEFVDLRAKVLPTEFLGIRTVKRDQLEQQQQDGGWSNAHRPPARAKSATTVVARLPAGVQSLEGPEPSGASADAAGDQAEGALPKLRSRLETYLRHSWTGSDSAQMFTPQEGAAVQGALPPESGAWEILWKAGGGNGPLRRLTFEASTATRTFIHRVVETWSDAAAAVTSTPAATADRQQVVTQARVVQLPRQPSAAAAALPGDAGAPPEDVAVAAPTHMTPGRFMPDSTEASTILSDLHIQSLAASVPARFRQSHWTLMYSTTRHGISLQTLYRRAAGHSPTILVIRDSSGFVFGAYCSEHWRVAPRYYGSGETFVFQLEPHLVAWHWRRQPGAPRNEYFQFSSPDSLAIGGGGHFAIWLDADLMYGHSGICDTFGSPTLSNKDEFAIQRLELWYLS